MSRGRVVEAMDALLGTASFRGEVVRSRHGVYTNADGLDAPDLSVEALVPRGSGGDDESLCSPPAHGKLRGRKRCRGCGRTRNEIEIDGG